MKSETPRLLDYSRRLRPRPCPYYDEAPSFVGAAHFARQLSTRNGECKIEPSFIAEWCFRGHCPPVFTVYIR